MIISHKHKFIFTKTRKTAGTSIELFLSRFCGPEDIITPFQSPENERNYSKNYFKNGFSTKILTLIKKSITPLHPYLIKSHYLQNLNKKTRDIFQEHMAAYEVRELISKDIWNSYYKFCFDRNPWDKTVSNYFFDKDDSNLGDISFEDYLKTENGKNLRWYNYPLYTYQDKIIVDFIGKYENLLEDMFTICNKIGIDFDRQLPKAKANIRPKGHHYSYYFNDENRELIRNHFKKEIDLHSYIFEKLEY